MSYRCEACKRTVPAGQSEKKWPLYKTVEESEVVEERCTGRRGQTFARRIEKKRMARQIDREIRICHNCYKHLENGVAVEKLLACQGVVSQNRPTNSSGINRLRRRVAMPFTDIPDEPLDE